MDSREDFDMREDMDKTDLCLPTKKEDKPKPCNHQEIEDHSREFKQSTHKEIHQLSRAPKKAGHSPLRPDAKRRTDLDYTRECPDRMTADQAAFHSRAGEVLAGCHVTPSRPTEVQCGQGKLNPCQYSAAKWCHSIDDNQYVVINGCGAAHPVSELFIARVPRPEAMQNDREVRAQKKRDSGTRWPIPPPDTPGARGIPRSNKRYDIAKSMNN